MLTECILRSAAGEAWDRRLGPLRRSGGVRRPLPVPFRRGNRSGSCCRRSGTLGLLVAPGGVSHGRGRRARHGRRCLGPGTLTGSGWSPLWTSSAGSFRCCCAAEGRGSQGDQPQSSYTHSCHRAPDLTASRCRGSRPGRRCCTGFFRR